jgi:hypothetical protein
MYNDAMFATQRDVAEKGLLLARELLPLMAPVGNYPDWSPKQRETLGMLLSAAARSSESAFLLMAYGQLWDAEVVLRSVFEASLKFAFIVQSRDDFEERFVEYDEHQFQIAILKDDQRVKELLAALPNPQGREWKPFREMLLSDAKRDELRLQYDRTKRRAMETKWGVNSLLTSLASKGDVMFSGFAGLAYGYSLASHIQHADYVGVSIPMDRDRRAEARRNSIHMAHLVRLVSDCFTCLQLRLRVGYRFIKCDPAPLLDATSKVDQLLASIGHFNDEWLKIEYENPGSNERQV